MKNSFKLLLLFVLACFSSCNKEKNNVINNEWIASSITYENGEYETPDIKARYLLSFEKKSQYSLQLDINLCGGEVSFKRKSVTFKKGMNCTEACCDSEFANALATKLPQTEKWQIDNNILSFSNDKGLKIDFIKK